MGVDVQGKEISDDVSTQRSTFNVQPQVLRCEMAHPKRTRSNVNGGKKQVAAKQASNKKKRTSLKCKNDELRSFLDSQAQSLHNLSTVCPKKNFHISFRVHSTV